MSNDSQETHPSSVLGKEIGMPVVVKSSIIINLIVVCCLEELPQLEAS